MKTVYTTNSYKGYHKHDSYNYKYNLDEDNKEIHKVKCSRFKFFDGHENNWETDEKVVDTWKIDDPSMPDWLHKYI